MFRRAIRWRLIAANPFEGVAGGLQTNSERRRFVPAETIEAIMAETPDPEWRAVMALARWGALRIPSESNALRWSDIDWQRGSIRVTVPKLAHREGKGERFVPLFPELRGPLLELFEAAEPGCQWITPTLRTLCPNLRQQFQRYIRRAGFKPWPRLWQNLRSSRESELMRSYDLATVCAWVGNSPTVAANHYATAIDLDADFRRAAGLDKLDGEAHQKAQVAATASDDPPMTGVEQPGAQPSQAAMVGNARQPNSFSHKSLDWAQQDSNLRPADYARLPPVSRWLGLSLHPGWVGCRPVSTHAREPGTAVGDTGQSPPGRGGG